MTDELMPNPDDLVVDHPFAKEIPDGLVAFVKSQLSAFSPKGGQNMTEENTTTPRSPILIDPDALRRELYSILDKAEELVAPKKVVGDPEATSKAIFDLGQRIAFLSWELSEAVTAIELLSKVQGKLLDTAEAYSAVFGTAFPDDQDFDFTTSCGSYALLDDDHRNYPTLGFVEANPLTDDDLPF